jgi:Mor family transcriptional regulator
MKKVQIYFNHKGQNIYVLANYYKGCPATLEEPAEEPSFDLLDLHIGKIEFDSVEDLSEHLECTEEEIYNLILFHIQDYLNNGQYF